ncbi:hypothetical protein BD413DRAFT_243096 [Trametes elegans]|nr:hypothetical protein BD413DRAFT_243096 [Trametes elegans]
MSDECPAKRDRADDERPAKRHRTEDGSTTSAEKVYAAPPSVVPAISEPALPTQSYKRDEDVWFSTGNIVLVTSYEVAFRVYQDVLSRRSEVFRGLFEFPQLPSGVEREFETETMDGCEVVHLSDAPSDLKQLLLVIYCRKNFFYLKDEPISVPFYSLSALIRMAHKYDVQDVYETALPRLRKYYTSDLERWLKPCDRNPYVETTVLDALAVIDLAYRIDAPELLPTAYLICCSLDGHTRLGNRVHEPILGDLGPWAHTLRARKVVDATTQLGG